MELRNNGAVINTAIVMATAEGLVQHHDVNLLAKHGRPIAITKHWARSLLLRMSNLALAAYSSSVRSGREIETSADNRTSGCSIASCSAHSVELPSWQIKESLITASALPLETTFGLLLGSGISCGRDLLYLAVSSGGDFESMT